MTKPSFGTRAVLVTTSVSSPASPERGSCFLVFGCFRSNQTSVRPRGDAVLTDKGSAVPVQLLLTGHLQEALLDGDNLFCNFINSYAAFIVAEWGLVLGGGVPPLFSRLTDVYTGRAAFHQTGPFHITGVFKGLSNPLS